MEGGHGEAWGCWLHGSLSVEKVGEAAQHRTRQWKLDTITLRAGDKVSPFRVVWTVFGWI